MFRFSIFALVFGASLFLISSFIALRAPTLNQKKSQDQALVATLLQVVAEVRDNHSARKDFLALKKIEIPFPPLPPLVLEGQKNSFRVRLLSLTPTTCAKVLARFQTAQAKVFEMEGTLANWRGEATTRCQSNRTPKALELVWTRE